MHKIFSCCSIFTHKIKKTTKKPVCIFLQSTEFCGVLTGLPLFEYYKRSDKSISFLSVWCMLLKKTPQNIGCMGYQFFRNE